MGAFFTTVSFPKRSMSKEQVTEKLHGAIRAVRLDDPDNFYILFDENKDWVTVYSDCLEEGDVNVFNFSMKLFEHLSVDVLAFQCVDSDFLLIGIANAYGLDITSVGTPYFLDEDMEIPEPSPTSWKPWFRTAKEYSCLLDIVKEVYVFAEDSLDRLANWLRFDPEDIRKTAEEARQDERLLRV